jgi:hypothetical protein
MSPNMELMAHSQEPRIMIRKWITWYWSRAVPIMNCVWIRKLTANAGYATEKIVYNHRLSEGETR